MFSSFASPLTAKTGFAAARCLLNARLASAVAAAILAGLIGEGWGTGSVIALVLLLPWLTILVTGRRRSVALWTGHALALLAITAVMIAPGPVNVAISWLALAFVAARDTGMSQDAYGRLWQAGHRLLASPLHMLRARRRLGLLARMMPNPRLLKHVNILVPFVTIGLFATLLAIANPLLADAFLELPWTQPKQFILSPGPMVLLATLLLLWPLVRPGKSTRAPTITETAPRWHGPYFKPGVIAVTLLILNLMFLAENLLDARYVWLDGQLPAQLTHAQYVHRGAYTLVATALAAAAFMIFALWPGSATAQSASVRALVYVWTAQNLVLVASSAKRTLSYVADYGMTEWRLAGLLWMGLVAVGLVSIAWRLARHHNNLWLINVNLMAAYSLLFAFGFVDHRRFVAEWNVDTFTQAGRPQAIDIAYLAQLGPSALPALRNLEATYATSQAALPDAGFLGPRTALLAANVLLDLREQQADWRNWTVRGKWLMRPAVTQGP